MKNRLTRRLFVKQSALAAGVFGTAPFNILSAANAGEKVRFVQIGCGGRGMTHLDSALKEHLVGLVEVDENRHAAVKKWVQGKGGRGMTHLDSALKEHLVGLVEVDEN